MRPNNIGQKWAPKITMPDGKTNEDTFFPVANRASKRRSAPGRVGVRFRTLYKQYGERERLLFSLNRKAQE